MSKIPKLYKNYPPGLVLTGAILAIAAALIPLDYTHLGEGDQVQPIEGVEHTEIDPSKSKVAKFMAQLLYQHVIGYPFAFDLPNLMSEMKKCIESNS